jgi:anti-sigma factor RsiW
MTCERWQEKIDLYLDGEISEAESRDLELHIDACPICSSETLARSQLKRNIHLAGKAFVADPAFRKRVQETVATESPRQRWFWIYAVGALCCAILVGTVATLAWTRYQQRQLLIGELTDLHVATLASENRVDVVSSDRHTVKPWFQGKLPFTFNLPDLQNSEFQLLGGRMTYLDQNPGAELLFTVRKHVLSVFIFKDSAELDRLLGSSQTAQKLSFNIESWSDAGLRYLIITDTSRADVDELRALLTAAAK